MAIILLQPGNTAAEMGPSHSRNHVTAPKTHSDMIHTSKILGRKKETGEQMEARDRAKRKQQIANDGDNSNRRK